MLGRGLRTTFTVALMVAAWWYPGEQRASATVFYDFSGVCDFSCEDFGIAAGTPVTGFIALDDSVATPNSTFLPSDVLAFNVVVGDFVFDFPTSPTQLTPTAFNGGIVDATGTGLRRVLLRGGPTPDVFFRFPDIINTTDTWRAVLCQADCIGTNVLKRALGTGAWTIRPPEPVAVDINPQSCPNSLKVNGGIRVAILGTDDFDATQVDPASVRLEGVAPVRSNLKDVATPFIGVIDDAFDCTDEGPDGYLDLTLKFDRPDIVEAIESTLEGEVKDGEVLILTLEGTLFDGTPIVGEDVVVIKKRGE